MIQGGGGLPPTPLLPAAQLLLAAGCLKNQFQLTLSRPGQVCGSDWVGSALGWGLGSDAGGRSSSSPSPWLNHFWFGAPTPCPVGMKDSDPGFGSGWAGRSCWAGIRQLGRGSPRKGEAELSPERFTRRVGSCICTDIYTLCSRPRPPGPQLQPFAPVTQGVRVAACSHLCTCTH